MRYAPSGPGLGVNTMIRRYLVEGVGEWDPDHVMSFENELGRFRISSGILTVVVHADVGADGEGRLEWFLRAWEFESELRLGFPDIGFRERTSEERPLQHESPRGWNDGVVILHKYPDPPKIQFVPEMAAAWRRFQRARMGFGESLQSCGYYVLTLVEARGGGRKGAASRFAIDESVLRKLGELTSAWTSDSPRKASLADAPRLQRAHERWISAAVRGLLFHVGAEAAGRVLEPLSLRSLPSI